MRQRVERWGRPGEIANLKAFHPVRFRYRTGPVHCVTGQALYTLATGQAGASLDRLER